MQSLSELEEAVANIRGDILDMLALYIETKLLRRHNVQVTTSIHISSRCM